MKNYKSMALNKAMILMSFTLLTSACNQSDEYFKKSLDMTPMKIEKSAGDGMVLVETKNPTKDPIKAPGDEQIIIPQPGVTPPTVPVAVPKPIVNPPKDPNKEECDKGAEACELTPVVNKAGVVTMLLAFGDLKNDKVVISEGSARLLAQNAVKFASPVDQPRILVVKDHKHNDESKNDTEYIAKVLLSNYQKVDVLNETSGGLRASHLEGYDLVWFNNPGYPMGSSKTMQTLKAFTGGVILSGDDMVQGSGFSTEPLTGLRYVNNGSSVKCGSKSHFIDNNSNSNRFEVEISSQFFSGISEDLRIFEYGNDIDLSVLAQNSIKYEVLAYAKPAISGCTEKRPVIVRYVK